MSLELEGPEFEKTVHDHARYLGLDPERHPQLLWIAVEALTAKVPSDWRVAATKNGSAYFYNTRTRETMWEHPLDEKFRSMVREQLAKLGELSPEVHNRPPRPSTDHLPSSLSSPAKFRTNPGSTQSQRHHRSKSRRHTSSGNSSGSDSDEDSDTHSQESRDAIVELESRLMQEVAQNKILQDQLQHEQALNRQYQSRSAESDVTILKLRGELSDQQSSLVASQTGESNQAEQARVLQEHLQNEQQKALQLQENLAAASADVRYMQSTMSVYQAQIDSLQSRCTDLEQQCAESHQRSVKATNLEAVLSAKNEILAQKNEDLVKLQQQMASDMSLGLPDVRGLNGANVAHRADRARMELANHALNSQQVRLAPLTMTSNLRAGNKSALFLLCCCFMVG